MDHSTDLNATPLCFSGKEFLLMHAIYGSNLDVVKLLLKQGQNVNYKCKHGMNAILDAIQMESQECVEMLLRNKVHVDEICTVTVDTTTEMDITPLILACQLNYD